MKRILIMSITLLLVVVAAAAEHDFNPRRFQADMETFIVKEAGLTPAQIDKFLPLFRDKTAPLTQRNRMAYYPSFIYIKPYFFLIFS